MELFYALWSGLRQVLATRRLPRIRRHNYCYQTLTIVRPNTPRSNVCSTQLPINHIILGGGVGGNVCVWGGVFAEYESHRKVSNSHFVGCEMSE